MNFGYGQRHNRAVKMSEKVGSGMKRRLIVRQTLTSIFLYDYLFTYVRRPNLDKKWHIILVGMGLFSFLLKAHSAI
jgi:hypothetical protein